MLCLGYYSDPNPHFDSQRLDKIELFKSKRIAEGLYDLPLIPEEVQPIAPELDANWEKDQDDTNLKDVEEDNGTRSLSMITLGKTAGKYY